MKPHGSNSGRVKENRCVFKMSFKNRHVPLRTSDLFNQELLVGYKINPVVLREPVEGSQN